MAAQGNGSQRAGVASERWQQIKAVLAIALERKPTDRAAYLDRACGDDASLRAEIENLLGLEQAVENLFLDTPPAGVPNHDLAPENHRIGRLIGPYQIAEQIGVGGMGEVYRAFRADDQYEKQVALKLVRTGRDSSFVLARFKSERQMLADLDHPNIARLLDGGTTDDGIPYFVMELIDGLPLNNYCDKQRLSISDRLQLFLQVCSAVQYAHQRLIVHRDLKPGNILVTTDGTPKLLDFGIAKILSATAVDVPDPTVSIFRPLTPGYASPEQIKGEPITTASDVYSLGVLLYELLTGHRPYRMAGQSPHEIARAVCEEEPIRPSSTVFYKETSDGSGNSVEVTAASLSEPREGTPEKLRKRLRGDLDNIVLMAMRKEPQRRYSSVDQFATDIRRHLRNLPVNASKDTFRYRTAKFLARHRAAVSTAVLVMIAVLAGLGATLYEAHQSKQNALRAEKRFNDVRALANSLMFEVHDAIKDLAGATPARKLLVSKALQYLQSLSQDSAGDPSLQNELADAYQKVGDVQGNPDYPNLGDTPGALASFRQALKLRTSAIATGNATAAMLRSLSADNVRVGLTLEMQGDYKTALQYYRQAFAIAQDVDSRASDLQSKQQLGSVYFALGRCYASLKDVKAALENYQNSAAIRETIAGSSPFAKMRLAGTYSFMARLLWSEGDRQKAIALHERAVEIMRELSDSDPTNASYREYLAEGNYGNGIFLQQNGELAKALVSYRSALVDLERLVAADPTEVNTRRDLAGCRKGIGSVLVQQGKNAEGLRSLRTALAIAEKLPQPDNADVLADVYEGLGVGLLRSSNRPSLLPSNKLTMETQACAAFKKSITLWGVAGARSGPDPSTDGGPQRLKREFAECETELSKLR